MKKLDNHVIDLYNAGYSCKSISKEYMCCDETIRHYLKNNNVVLRKPSSYRKYTLNEDYFKIINDEYKAWLIGFLIADGSIYIHNDGYYIGFELSIKDEEILHKIRNMLSASYPITTNKTKTAVCLRVSSKIMYNDLLNLNICQNKTKYGVGDITSYIDKSLWRHCLRGIIDGDGWISASIRNCKSSPIIGVLGYSETLFPLITEMCTQLDIKVPKSVRVKSNYDIYQYQIGGMNQCKLIFKYLYNNANIYLQRKYKKLEGLVE